jgi:hypothetical protein
MNLTILDNVTGENGGTGVLPYLPLKLQGRRTNWSGNDESEP